MNTLGFQRGYMAKGMEVEKFLKVIIETLSREFEKEVKVEDIGEDQIRIVIDNYDVRTSMNYLEQTYIIYLLCYLLTFLLLGYNMNFKEVDYIKLSQ